METQNIKWDYLVVVCDAYGVRTSQIQFEVLSVNGDTSIRQEYEKEINTALIGTKIEKVKAKKGPPLTEFLQTKGQEGWEVCGSSASNDVNVDRVFCVILKRPIH